MKTTHTDQYLGYDSHHPQSVKRGVVKCLYDRTERLVTKPAVTHLQGEETFVFCPHFQRLSLLFRAEGHQDKTSSPQQRACGRV